MALFSHHNQEQLSETSRHNLLLDHFQGRSFLYHRRNRNRLGTYTAELYIIEKIIGINVVNIMFEIENVIFLSRSNLILCLGYYVFIQGYALNVIYYVSFLSHKAYAFLTKKGFDV